MWIFGKITIKIFMPIRKYGKMFMAKIEIIAIFVTYRAIIKKRKGRLFAILYL